MVTIANKDSDEIEFFNTWEESLGDKFYDEYNPKNNLEFNHWSIDDIKSFALKVEDIYEKSTKYYSNKKELRNLNAEEKINVMLGEFLYFSGQKLLSPEMREYIKDLPEIFEKHDLYVDCAFSALIVPPKGYPVSGRQIVRHDTEPKGRFQWGLRFDEEELIDPILNSPNRHKKEIKTKLKM